MVVRVQASSNFREVLLKILVKIGFVVDGQRGSHVKIKKRFADRVIVTIVPLHKELDTGTLLGILRQAEVSREEFIELTRYSGTLKFLNNTCAFHI